MTNDVAAELGEKLASLLVLGVGLTRDEATRLVHLLIAAARDEERERCAGVADNMERMAKAARDLASDDEDRGYHEGASCAAASIAAQIRNGRRRDA
jgi:hypothetical protein